MNPSMSQHSLTRPPEAPRRSPVPRRPARQHQRIAIIAACCATWGLPAAGSTHQDRVSSGQPAQAAAPAVSADNPAGIDWVAIRGFSIARTETTIGQFRRYAQATRLQTLAERQGGGSVYEAGWTRKPGWIWSAPYGPAYRPSDDEPVAHVTYDEAQGFCGWAGGRLPDDRQWQLAAYTELRAQPPPPFVNGRTYRYPVGDRPDGAHCLEDCGPAARTRSVPHAATLLRGFGHARVGQSRAGVNGLFDMGANLWEWVDEPRGQSGSAERLTRGGSWWYGSGPMRADHLQSKPGDTAVVYIGFRCVRSDAGYPKP